MPDRTANSATVSSPGSRRVFLVQAGSLVATAWMVWASALVPRLHYETLGSIIGRGLGYALIAWLWSAIIAFGLYAVVQQQDRTAMLPNVLRTAATAVWFGPALILLSEFSPAALLAALVLVVYASRLLYAQWRQEPLRTDPLPYVPREPGSFADCQLPRAFVWRDRVPAIAIAFCLQAGVAGVAMHYPLIGAGWLCLATGLLTVLSMVSGAAGFGRPPTLPRSILGVLLTIVMAAMLTMAGEVADFADGHGGFGSAIGYGPSHPSLVESARILLRRLFYGEIPVGRGGTTAKAGVPAAPASDTGALGGFPGVILWPEVKPIVTLVAPIPSGGTSLFHGPHPQPLGIPFAGEYWMFRWPYAHPPQKSYFQRGTPTHLSFSTTDHIPLQMEAHHKLDTPIDVECCAKIQVEIFNADRYPGTMTLELELVDNGAPRPQFISLGSRPVLTTPDLRSDPIQAVRETLDFPINMLSRAITQFDEFKVVFHRRAIQLDKSAKISVERFVLVPR